MKALLLSNSVFVMAVGMPATLMLAASYSVSLQLSVFQVCYRALVLRVHQSVSALALALAFGFGSWFETVMQMVPWRMEQ